MPEILKRIAIAESGGMQFNKDGKVIISITGDIGKYQIAPQFWGQKAKELGYDLYSEQGNTLMAIWIFQNFGTSPWNWSRSKWEY